MSLTDRDLLNSLLILSTAITEMIELEAQVMAKRHKSKDLLVARKEYLSFWLRTQSFFITAKALTDREPFKDFYIQNTSKDWRHGIRVMRNFFSHEVKLIPSAYSFVRFIPEESVSISLKGFTISVDNAEILLTECIESGLKKESHEKGTLSPSQVQQRSDVGILTLNCWKSKSDPKVVFITDIATQYYMKIYKLLSVLRAENKVIVSESDQPDSGIIPLKDKLQLIDATAVQVKEYRANKFMWDII